MRCELLSFFSIFGIQNNYSDLTAIFKVINPLLKKHGLGFTQLVGDGAIKTIVFHVESGEQIETTTTIPQGVSLKGMNDFQVLGSAITYIRRYAISAMLGLITDKDLDALQDDLEQMIFASNVLGRLSVNESRKAVKQEDE